MSILRHPPGLAVLFLSEMWERFGFYCMAAVFALYMKDKNNGHPFLQDEFNRAQILGLYLGFVYFTPFFGGILADQRFGYRKSVIIGAIFLGAGYLFLAFSPLWSFFTGLMLIVIGNGLFKPNISVLVGKLYAPNDPRLDSAYTIFYMGINLGAFSAPLVAGVLCNIYRIGSFDGYYAAFVAAGIGMFVSMVTFMIGGRWLPPDAPNRKTIAQADPDIPPAVQKRRHLALLVIFVVVALFWMAFKQNAGTFNYWFENHTYRTPQPWLADLLQTTLVTRSFMDSAGQLNKTLQSAINPFFVIAFSPLMVFAWQALKRRGSEPSTPGKLTLGMLLASMAFGTMMLAGLSGGDTGLVSGYWLVGTYAILTTGELCLSPMGLSLVSKLAAPRQRSMWMGGWFVATAVGGYLSGAIGGFWNQWSHSTFFGFLACSSLVAMGIMLGFLRWLRNTMPPAK